MLNMDFFPNGVRCERCGFPHVICTCGLTRVELGIPWYLDPTIRIIPCVENENGEFVPVEEASE